MEIACEVKIADGCVLAHIYKNIHICIHIHEYLPTYNIYVCLLSYICVCIHTYRLMDVCACTHSCMHAYIPGDSCMPNIEIQKLMFAYKHACMLT